MKKPPEKTQVVRLVPLLARGIAPTAAMVSGLLAPPIFGAQGDLDPAFADVGRLGPIIDFRGPAWSAEQLDNDRTLLAGGDLVCDYYCYYYHTYDAANFLSEISATGSSDSTFTAAALAHTAVFDVALEPDGGIVGVGEFVASRKQQLAVFRLTSDGALDPTFGAAGVFRLPGVSTTNSKGTSVALEPDGRIVVARSRCAPSRAHRI
jgi:predicted transcriptional regulator with HTH domain